MALSRIGMSIALLFSTNVALFAETIPFQGLATRADGTALQDGGHRIRFALYSDSVGAGPALWDEYQVVSTRKGLFQVELGSITSIPDSVFRDGGGYLGVSIGDDSEGRPRLRIGAVPWAIHARSAEKSRVSMFADSAGRVAGMSDSLSAHRSRLDAHGSILDALRSDVDSVRSGVQRGVQRADSASFAEASTRSILADTASFLVGFPDSLAGLRAGVDSNKLALDSLGSRFDFLVASVEDGVRRADTSTYSHHSDSARFSLDADSSRFASFSDSARAVTGLQDSLIELRRTIASQDRTIRRMQDAMSSIGRILNATLLPSSGQLLDVRDGQVYPTTKIGEQVWMAGNLNYAVDSSWCYTEGLEDCGEYGRLYTWESVLGFPGECDSQFCAARVGDRFRGICPVGWHVPADSEWSRMISWIGADSAGRVLKSKSGWPSENVDPLGYGALPGGFRFRPHIFLNKGWAAGFWSSTEQDKGYSWCYHLAWNDDLVTRYSFDKTYAVSLRCVKD